jgi:transcriptional regulator with XRE-family HTH domain
MLHIGKTAKYVREKKGLTVREAAHLLGITHVHLVNIENNHSAPSLNMLDKFKATYGVDLPVLAWCLFGDPERLPPAVRGPMMALADAWRKELGDIAKPSTDRPPKRGRKDVG